MLLTVNCIYCYHIPIIPVIPDAVPEKIEAEVQTNDPEEEPSNNNDTENKDLGSPTTQLKKCLHEREAIIMLLQAEVDRQANELNYLRSGDATGTFRRAKSFSARDKKTFVCIYHSLFAWFRHLRGEPRSQAQICAHCGAYSVS